MRFDDQAPHDGAHTTEDHPESPSLSLDLNRIARRRALLMISGAAGTGLLAACGGGSGGGSSTSASSSSSSTSSSTSSSASASSSSASTSSASSSTSSAATCGTALPTETNGPYPGDGTNTNSSGSVVDVLTQSGIVRSDIRSSFGSASATAQGVPFVLTITLESASQSCATLPGYAIYIWHCTRDGLYSLYSTGLTGENYLRGVQVADSNGQVTFTTIFPGCYTGRMPHIHVEVYASQSTATSGNNAVKITQLAFDRSTCATVYANASGYSSSTTALNGITFATDNVFGDDTTAQLAASMVSLSGDYTNGFTGTINLVI